jgi:hypothetical protein
VLRGEAPTNWLELQNQRRARQLFVEHFSDEQATIEEELSSFPGVTAIGKPGLLDALCGLNPAHKIIQDLYSALKADKRPAVAATAYYAIALSCVESDQLLEFTRRHAMFARTVPIRLSLIGEYFLKRVQRDSSVREEIEGRLGDKGFAAIKVSLFRAVALTAGSKEDIYARARALLTEELNTSSSRFGLDIFGAEVQANALSLLAILDTIALRE